MAPRSRIPRGPDSFRSYHDDASPVLNGGLGPYPFQSATLEEELQIQQREMRKIIAENQLVFDDCTLLQRELTALKREIFELGQLIPHLQAEKETQARELIQENLKLEAVVRASEPVKTEVMQLNDKVEELTSFKQLLTAQVQGMKQDITRAQAENQQLPMLRADVDRTRMDLAEARRTLEYEKKAKEDQVEQRQLMDNKLIDMAREIEKLRSQLMNRERGTRGSDSQMRYPGSACGNPGSSTWGPYDDKHLPGRYRH